MRKKVLIIGLIVLTICLTGCGKTTKQEQTDSLKFKEEYESINNKKSKSSGKNYRELSISTDNPFIYANASDIVKKIKNKESFVVYFGFKECPWCRSVLEQLIKAAKDKEIESIYYVDVTGIRDVKEFDEEGNIKTIEEGSPDYLQLVEEFKDVLDDYTLTKDDEEIAIDEKRIYAPNVIAVSTGKAIQLETGISDELKDPYAKLTKSIKKYSYNKFSCLFKCFEEESTTCKKNSC